MNTIIDLEKYLGVETLVEYSKSENIKQVLGLCPVYNILLCRMNNVVEEYHAEVYAQALEEYNKRDAPAEFIEPNIWGDIFSFLGRFLKWIVLAIVVAILIYLVVLFTPYLISFAKGLASTHTAKTEFKNSKIYAASATFDAATSVLKESGAKIAQTKNNKLSDGLSTALLNTVNIINHSILLDADLTTNHGNDGIVQNNSLLSTTLINQSYNNEEVSPHSNRNNMDEILQLTDESHQPNDVYEII